MRISLRGAISLIPLSCRAFRIFMSSKVGKTAILKATTRFGGPVIAMDRLHSEGSEHVTRRTVNNDSMLGNLQSSSGGSLFNPTPGLDCLLELSGPAVTTESLLGPCQLEELFFSSLVCHVDPCSRLLRAYDESNCCEATRHQGE